jgi:hypothetical protein
MNFTLPTALSQNSLWRTANRARLLRAGRDRVGELIAEDTLEQVIKVKKSYTGQFLKGHMK